MKDEAPTLPFTLDQIERMLKACLNYPHKYEGHFDTTILLQFYRYITNSRINIENIMVPGVGVEPT
jgi:hypothetical protein